MPRSLTLFTLFGTPVRAHISWPIALIIITAALGVSISAAVNSPQENAAAYALATATALAIAASVVIHEFAHVLTARRFGIQATDITLFALGGVSHLDHDDAGTPRVDAAVSIAGPVMSLAVGLALGAALRITNTLDESSTSGFLLSAAEAFSLEPAFLIRLGIEYVAIANIVIGLANLIPLFPLDGGRILSAILWMMTGSQVRAVKTAALIGQAGAAGIILYGAYNLFFGELLPGVWLTVIGVFLMEGAVREGAEQAIERPVQ